MTDDEAGEGVSLSEHLGRGVFSKRHAQRAKRAKAPLNIFLERRGVLEVSVDRLDVAPLDEAVTIAKDAAAQRGAEFYGWAVVFAEQAASGGRTVSASPIVGRNLYHADIVLPKLASEDREEQKRHAQELADLSRWRSNPQD